MMKYRFSSILFAVFTAFTLVFCSSAASETQSLQLVNPDLSPNLYIWTDTCNVYVLKDNDKALLIDLGDGSVLPQLADIGVKQVEWVLFTHHHREQCQGVGLLKNTGAKLAAPKAEQSLFEQPTSFRKMKPSLNDKYSVYGASYVRPPVEAIPLDRVFIKDVTFEWNGYTINCRETPGNSPGAMSYFLKINNQDLVFSGDVMLDGEKMHNWFDTEWDYGYGTGLEALIGSVNVLIDLKPECMLPSHGPVIYTPNDQLPVYLEKLNNLNKLYVRGYPVGKTTAAEQDSVSKATVVPGIGQVTPHVFKFTGSNTWCNFGIIIADSGNALAVDCGCLGRDILDKAINGMKTHFGLKSIEALVISHMHGDHIQLGPHLRNTYGTEIWTLDRITDTFEHPERYDYAAMIPSYNAGFESCRIDRSIKPGTKINWEGYKLTLDWMPGQTEFGCCLWLDIDGKRIAFTGDNIFGNPDDPAQNGHEALVARNSAIIEEGYLYGANYLKKLKPDIMMGGHSFVMDNPAQFIERYHQWAQDIIKVYQELSPDPEYHYRFDPYWVHAEPYRVTIRPGESAQVNISVRNFLKREQKHSIRIHTPPGIIVDPAILTGQLNGETRQLYPVKLTAAPDSVKGINTAAFDITFDNNRYGEWFDMIVLISER